MELQKTTADFYTRHDYEISNATERQEVKN